MFPWSNQPLAECDPDVADLIEREKNRQWRGLELIASEVQRTHRVLFVTEEPVQGGFAQALAGRVASTLFTHLDAPPLVVGSLETPAIPLNEGLERFVLNSGERTGEALRQLLAF
jgi:pyruvate/2-oxoglutarate/acetoin dehydrogenase E1 component